MREQITFYPLTSAEKFADYLRLETNDTNRIDFPHFSLNPGVVNNDHTFVTLYAHLKTTKINEGEICDLPIGKQYQMFDGEIHAIHFDLFHLADARTRVKARIYLEDAFTYFVGLLRRIAKDYPETQQDLSLYLEVEATEPMSHAEPNQTAPDHKESIGGIHINNSIVTVTGDFIGGNKT